MQGLCCTLGPRQSVKSAIAALTEALGTREPVRPPLPKGIEKFYYRGDFLVVQFWSAIANRLITRVDIGVEDGR